MLNRAAGRIELFRHEQDYAAFLRTFQRTLEHAPMPVCGFCLMPNHWHLVLWPENDGQLARFMQRLTITHVRNWVEHRHRVGYGPVYQGRYKSFAMQEDGHFTTVLRYVERNPLRAKLVPQAQRWRWSSLGQMGRAATKEVPCIELCKWPMPRRPDWVAWVNQPQTAAEEKAVEHALKHGRPLGDERWTAAIEKQLRLGPLRPRGRPPKPKKTERLIMEDRAAESERSALLRFCLSAARRSIISIFISPFASVDYTEESL